MIEYVGYLKYLDSRLAKYFQAQAPYICCKKGCAKCCKYGDYPYSQTEVEYLLTGFEKLPEESKLLIIDKIKTLKSKKLKNQDENFQFECPFLINDECSVYDYRGIICRTFGLISYRENANSKVPFCAFEGLNYSSVVDEEKKIISDEKFRALNIDVEPLAYDIGYKYLTSEKYEKALGFKFGEVRSLIDWLE
ncbi:MAG: YkgJ family cysteine cluster protein [Muribaculaceae bacterium]|nr:YkgJ family cysteine cluster protein [Muribaculaceae bacterium]